jgi:hypothetical protein
MPPTIIALDRRLLVKVLVTAMFASLAIDMGGEFGLRNVVVPLCGLMLVALSGPVLPGRWLFPFMLLVAYPTGSLILGLAGGAALPLAFSQYQSTILAFALYVLLFHVSYTDTSRALLLALFAVAMLAVALAVGLALGLGGVPEILAVMADRGGGFFGERGVGIEDIFPNVYFKATLFFVPAFVLALFTRRRVIASFCFLGLVVAISKTGMIVVLLVAAIHFARTGSTRERLAGGILLLAAIVGLSQTPLATLFLEIVQNDSATVNVRAGHLESLLALWKERPASFLFGFGLGSTFFSSGEGGIVSNIEIDHFNVVRKYGLFWATAFFVWVGRVAWGAIRDHRTEVRGLGWSLAAAFLVAGTNPVLISPLFFVFLFVTMAAVDQAEANPESPPDRADEPVDLPATP